MIKEFQSDKASDISVRVFKRVAVHVAEHLSGFINNFMEVGTFPKSLKIGKISPIHKKGDVTFSYLTITAPYRFYQYLVK